MVDFDSVKGFSQVRPLRQFIYGLALCFLAALLAVEAKAAWVANDRSPNDISAVKLSPAPGEHTHAAIAAIAAKISSGDGHDHIDLVAVILEAASSKRGHTCIENAPSDAKQFIERSFLSSSLFFRPPPTL